MTICALHLSCVYLICSSLYKFKCLVMHILSWRTWMWNEIKLNSTFMCYAELKWCKRLYYPWRGRAVVLRYGATPSWSSAFHPLGNTPMAAPSDLKLSDFSNTTLFTPFLHFVLYIKLYKFFHPLDMWFYFVTWN